MNKAVALSVLLLVTRINFAPIRVTGAMSTNVVIPNIDETFEVGMLRVEHRGIPGGTPIIFIPALFCGSWQWERQIAALSDRYDIYALTLPGFDGRPRDTGGKLMDRAVSDLSELIRSRHLNRPILVGHSLGGTLAILFAETHPSQPGAVVVADGGYPVAPTAALREQQAKGSTAPYLGLHSGAAFGAVLRKNMLQYVITNKVDIDSMERRASRTDPGAMVEWMRAALLLDLTPGLRSIRVPLTEIVPSDSVIDPYRGFSTEQAKRAAYESWVSHAPHGSVVMIPQSRHFVMLDQPTEFDRALYAAIERVVTHGSTGS